MHPVVTATLAGLFTQWSKGRLKPLPFALLFGGVMLLGYASSLAFTEAVANPVSPDRRGAVSAAQPLSLWQPGPYQLWLSLGLLCALAAAGANVMAKRFRDMGLPGGLTVSMLAIMLMVLLGAGSSLSWITNIFVFAVFLALLAVPTDHLEAGSGLPRPKDRDSQQGR